MRRCGSLIHQPLCVEQKRKEKRNAFLAALRTGISVMIFILH